MDQPHRHAVRVYYEDTDAGGIVFYANYLKFAERGRTEFLRAAGFEHRALAIDHGAGFAVRRCEADYLIPARLDDLLRVETVLTKASGARLEMIQTVVRERDDAVLCRMKIVLALIDGKGRPMRLPAEMVSGFGSLVASNALE